MNLRPILTPALLGIAGLAIGPWLRPAAGASPSSPSNQATRPLKLRPAATGITGSTSDSLARWSAQVNDIPPGELPDLAVRLAADPHRGDRALWAPLIARWSGSDGPGLIAWIEKQAPPVIRQQLFADAWFAWGASDPDAAFAASSKLTPALCKNLLVGIGEIDPAKAASLAMKMRDAQSILYSIGDSFLSKTPDSLDGLLKSAVYDGSRHPLQKARIDALVRTDPAAAIDYARHCGVLGSDPVPLTIGKIATTDPAQAARQVAALPPNRERALSTTTLARTWAAADPAAALAWVRQLDDGPVKQASLRAAAGSAALPPQQALALLQESTWDRLPDFYGMRDGHITPSESLYTPTLKNIAGDLLRKWAVTDPAAASDYLQTTVPAELREKIGKEAGLPPQP